MKALIVREPFGDYAKGQAITDPDEIAKVEADRSRSHDYHAVDLPEGFFKPDEPQPASVAVQPVPAAAPTAVAPTASAAPAAPAIPPVTGTLKA